MKVERLLLQVPMYKECDVISIPMIMCKYKRKTSFYRCSFAQTMHIIVLQFQFHKYVFKKIQMISFDYLFPHTVHKNGVLISKANDQFSTLVEEWFILLHLQLSERMSSIECAVVHVYSQFIFSLIFQCKKKAADFLIGSVMMLLVLTAKCFSTIMFDFKGKSLS